MDKHQSCLSETKFSEGNQFGMPSDIATLDIRRLNTPPGYSISGLLAPNVAAAASEHHENRNTTDANAEFANRFLSELTYDCLIMSITYDCLIMSTISINIIGYWTVYDFVQSNNISLYIIINLNNLINSCIIVEINMKCFQKFLMNCLIDWILRLSYSWILRYKHNPDYPYVILFRLF